MYNNEDELYSGYDENNPLAGTAGSAMFQSYSAESGQGVVPGTASTRGPMVPGTAMRMGTASVDSSAARPMTSNRGAGFSSSPKKFDAMNQSRASVASSVSLAKKTDASPEEQARDMEKKVHELLEDSAKLLAESNNAAALEKASEARKKERALCRFREANGLGDQINVDLTFAVDFNLAQTYHQNRLYQEALDAYTTIIKNKQLPQSGRLRVNMGNIYFEQKKYSNAIKMYRMALDQLPATSKEVRFKIMRNIGTAFVRMGQYQDALQAFETVMEQVPDHQTAYNLVVCCYALGDKERMKRSFLDLVKLPGWSSSEGSDEVDEDGEEDDDAADVVRVDGLREELRRRQGQIKKCILTSVQLIAEKIDRTGFAAGYDWCAEQLRNEGHNNMANEVDLAKASKHLECQEFAEAIAVFKQFERKEKRLKARAATNLACLYLLEGDLQSAERYSDLAIETDRYNARAFVNKGAVMAGKGDLPAAVQLLEEAVGIEPYCVEAVYNAGLMNLRAGNLEQALATFRKLHNMVPDNTDVMFQIGNCYDAMGEYKMAVKWLEMLSSLVPTDPGVLAKLGSLHARYEDDAKALHYYLESHRVLPVNMDVISWLGAFHVKNEVYEKAIPYFDLASKIQPQEVKWSLMVASCYRRIGAIPQALSKYKDIHSTHPDNIECLRYLVHLCTDLGRRDDAHEYLARLRRAERTQAAETQAVTQAAAQAAQGQGTGTGDRAVYVPNNQFTGPDEPAYQMPPMQGRKVKMVEQRGGKDRDDDEWGNEELGEDLLPM